MCVVFLHGNVFNFRLKAELNAASAIPAKPCSSSYAAGNGATHLRPTRLTTCRRRRASKSVIVVPLSALKSILKSTFNNGGLDCLFVAARFCSFGFHVRGRRGKGPCNSCHVVTGVLTGQRHWKPLWREESFKMRRRFWLSHYEMKSFRTPPKKKTCAFSFLYFCISSGKSRSFCLQMHQCWHVWISQHWAFQHFISLTN